MKLFVACGKNLRRGKAMMMILKRETDTQGKAVMMVMLKDEARLIFLCEPHGAPPYG